MPALLNSPVAEQHSLGNSLSVKETREALFRYAILRVRNPQTAEDLVQESFLGALRNFSGFSGQSSMKTWLVGILKHKIIDHFRQVGRERIVTPDGLLENIPAGRFSTTTHQPFPVAGLGSSPFREYEQKEFRLEVGKCLEALSPKMAEVFSLWEFEGKDAGAICQIMNLTESNLWVILHRARRALRGCLYENWFS